MLVIPKRRRYQPRMEVLALLGLVTSIFSAPIYAEAYEDVEDIRQQVADFVENHDFGNPYPVTAVIGKLDDRLRLRKCASPIDIHFASKAVNTGRTFLAVSCPGDTPWTVYISATVEAHADVLLAGKPLIRGEIITADDLVFATRKLSSLRSGYYTDRSQLVGLQLKRAINTGDALTPLLVVPRTMVKRGQQVTLLATTGGIKVRMKGKALADATHNTLVKVKNASSGRIVEGLVSGDGLVKISM